MLEIKAGKYYETRDGRKVGPMRPTDNSYWPFAHKMELYYRLDGSSCRGSAHLAFVRDDIVAEWADA